MATKYYLYARKSTEDDDHQIMSIEAQLFELREYAKREGLEVIEEFTESKSAKSPGREKFNELVQKVEASEGSGILAWHPDRLARNSVDGGKIIYLVDTKKIVSLRFPTFWFEPTPQGLFMLQVAFGQSKYYSDNLVENINRGFRQKIRRGEWLTKAPFGYVNNPRTRTIEPHPVYGKAVVKAFEQFASGEYTYESLADYLFDLGVETKNRTPLGKASIWRMLTNRAYLGLTRHKGEYFEGTFPALLSPKLFNAVQEIMQRKAKPRKAKRTHDFPLRGLLSCGECGCAITGQYTYGKLGGLYLYYRCTKKRGPCSQKFLQEKELLKQLQSALHSITLPYESLDRMLEQIAQWEQEDTNTFQIESLSRKTKLADVQDKLDRLVSAYLDQDIPKEIYLVKKEELLKQKLALTQNKRSAGKGGRVWLKPLKQWILELKQATSVARSNDLSEIKLWIQKVGSNPQLLNKEVKLRFRPPFSFVPQIRANLATAIEKNRKKFGSDSLKNLSSSFWWRCRELNPGPDPVYLLIDHKISPFKYLNFNNGQIEEKGDLLVLATTTQIKLQLSVL